MIISLQWKYEIGSYRDLNVSDVEVVRRTCKKGAVKKHSVCLGLLRSVATEMCSICWARWRNMIRIAIIGVV